MKIKLPKEWNLAYFHSGEWQVVEEKLNDEMGCFNPGPSELFAALRAVHPTSCRVAIMGQDPYPKLEHCTGIAFSTPARVKPLPPSLVNIFKEYEDDLGFQAPEFGDLTKWCEQGVLLWNVYPSCATGKPGSHHWPEWEDLTKEIIEKLDGQATFVFLGNSAGSFARYCTRSPVIRTSHPSPLGARYGFLGSHVFSRINDTLENKIDWRL